MAACTLWKEETTAHLWIGKLRTPTSSPSAGWLTISKLLHPKTASLSKQKQCFKAYFAQIINQVIYITQSHSYVLFSSIISMINQLFENKMQLAHKYSCMFYFVFVLRQWVEIKENCEKVAVLSLFILLLLKKNTSTFPVTSKHIYLKYMLEYFWYTHFPAKTHMHPNTDTNIWEMFSIYFLKSMSYALGGRRHVKTTLTTA